MGLPQAEYHFKSAVTYGSTSVDASDGYLPAGAFHKSMAEGMLELTRALMEISDRLDALSGGAGPSRPTVDPGSIVGSAGGVLVADPAPDPTPDPAPPSGSAGPGLPGSHTTLEGRRRRTE